MDLLTKDNDLLINSEVNDLFSADNENEVLLSQIIEAMDMSIADDIDYPEIFSNQRFALNSDDKADELQRIQDILRILYEFSEIETDTISVTPKDGKLSISFKTLKGNLLEVNR